MFLPTTIQEMQKLGWQQLDIIIVTGDTYIDSPHIGAAAIGKFLFARGYRVGIIAQPDTNSNEDITRLGEPVLFWGVTGGSVDSMVANYTSSDKRRNQDDFTPGEVNNRRPDRAVIAYTNLIRRNFKNTRPVVLGGIEASLRRITHYDYWSNSVRRPLLFDAKADYIVYGMAEKGTLALADAIKESLKDNPAGLREKIARIKGICYISNQAEFEKNEISRNHLALPDYAECSDASHDSKLRYIDLFRIFYENTDPPTARGIYQKVGDRYLIQNPPQSDSTEEELDSYYDLPYERAVHPYYATQGKVRALDTIRFSITTHRGCYGECNFCAITVHQGRTIQSRSEKSILDEARTFTDHPAFKGVISDIGGPTANMYGFECTKKLKAGVCADQRCIFPETCDTLKPSHLPQINLLGKIKNMDGIKHAFVASGIRYDLILDDRKYGREYLKEVIQNHTSGQMKIAPEHTNEKVLSAMGKPASSRLNDFVDMFQDISLKNSAQTGKKQFLTYYFIAAHPGCSEKEMREVKEYVLENLAIHPEQVQIYTPTPSTWSAVMYYTGLNPLIGEGKNYPRIFVETNPGKKIRQKEILSSKPHHFRQTPANHHHAIGRKKNRN